jgi:hypothetical protein
MANRPVADRKTRATIGEIISALDDRNVLRAMRLLEPASEGAELSLNSDQHDETRCVKCATRGE